MKKLRYLFIALFFITFNSFAANSIHFEITGIQDAPLKNAQERLDRVTKTYPPNPSPDDIKHIVKRIPDEILKALQPFGYYKPQISQQLAQKGSDWVAAIHVDKGPALHIAHLEVVVQGDGAHNDHIQQALKTLPIRQGDILQTTQYEKAKEALFNACNNAGYIKANFEKTDILINLQTYQATVNIQIQTGPRYYFGETIFGNSPYATHFLQRMVPYKKGQPFSNQQLIQLQQDMASAYYFDQVSILPDFQKAHDQQIPVQINTDAPRSQRYNMGIGYGTFTGPRMTAGVSFRRLTDTGQHFDASMRLSSVLSGISGKYYIPGNNPLTDRWIMGANYQKFAPKNGDSRSKSFLAGYIRKIRNLQTSLHLNYLSEQYSVLNQANRSSHLLYPSLTAGYIKADDLINPTHGYSLNMSLQGATEHVASSTRFIQADAKAKYIVSPFSFAKIITRAELGYTMVHNLYDLPLTMRYFAGGLNSIRGFPDSSIGPGKYLQVGSVEYQNKLYGNVSGAAFYDIGSASDHVGTPINRGAGVGLIYNSAVGPIKIYIGRAISKKEMPYDVEFSIGPEF